jgi:hypothetical protein
MFTSLCLIVQWEVVCRSRQARSRRHLLIVMILRVGIAGGKPWPGSQRMKTFKNVVVLWKSSSMIVLLAIGGHSRSRTSANAASPIAAAVAPVANCSAVSVR